MRKKQAALARAVERRQQTPPVASFIELPSLERQITEQVEGLIAGAATKQLVHQPAQRDLGARLPTLLQKRLRLGINALAIKRQARARQSRQTLMAKPPHLST